MTLKEKLEILVIKLRALNSWTFLISLSRSKALNFTVLLLIFLLPLLHSFLPQSDICLEGSTTAMCAVRTEFIGKIKKIEYIYGLIGIALFYFIKLLLRIYAPSFTFKYPNWSNTEEGSPDWPREFSHLFKTQNKYLTKDKTLRSMKEFFKDIGVEHESEQAKIDHENRKLDSFSNETWNVSIQRWVEKLNVKSGAEKTAYNHIMAIANHIAPGKRLSFLFLFIISFVLVFFPAGRRLFSFILFQLGG